MDIRKTKLTRSEKIIERNLERGLYKPVSRAQFKKITEAITNWRRDAVLNIRVNSRDLKLIKKKAKKLGIPYQTYISEFLHHLAA